MLLTPPRPQTIRCLLINPHVDVEGHLAQLMPAVLTCLVAQRLGPKDGRASDHWRLRREAADLTALICQKFGPTYPNLKVITPFSPLSLTARPAQPPLQSSSPSSRSLCCCLAPPALSPPSMTNAAASLQSRITKQLHNALADSQRSMSTHYGAVVGLSSLGPR